MIVEDDSSIASALSEILNEEGYQTSFAVNGLLALEYLRSNPLPDIILLDLMMPVMSGIEFRTQQIADPKLAKIPTVVMSADGNAQSKIAHLEVKNFLKKPLDINDLLDIVGSLI